MVWLPWAAGMDHIPRSSLYTLVESKKPVQSQCPRTPLHHHRAALTPWPQWSLLGEPLGARYYGHGVPGFWWNLPKVLGSTNCANHSLPTPDSLGRQFILILAANCTSGLDSGKGCTVKLSNSPCVTQLP